MNTFTFSIKQNTKQSFDIFRRHMGFFGGVALVTILLSIVGDGHTHVAVKILLTIASYLWAIVWLKLSLHAARGDESFFTFASLRDLLPTWVEIWYVLGVGLLAGLITLCGLILLIIPGIYVWIRLSFANLAYLDRKEGVQQSVRYSWEITKGKFWTVFLTGLLILLMYFIGIITLGIGLLIMYPTASILRAKLYLALSDDYNKREAVVVQPVEIPQDLPEVETA